MDPLHLTEIAVHLAARIAKAQAKNPDLYPGILRNIARMEAAQVLLADTLDSGGDGQTNGGLGTGGADPVAG